MDILDIILGSALTPQGEIESFAARAEKAVADANAAVNNIESITEQTNANNAAAQEALNTVNEALNNLNIPESIADAVDTALDKLAFELTSVNTTNMNSTRLVIHHPDGDITNLDNLVKYYTATGQNTDGTMTQKAITNAISTAIANIEFPESNTVNLGAQNANKVVIVGADGRIIPSASATEEMILSGGGSGGQSGGPDEQPTPSTNTGIVGVRINYTTSTTTPTDDAINATTADFNNFAMYGGRKKCLVNDMGIIQAFYGDNDYNDTPSNGYQVMVYQPKFYYKRTILQSSTTNNGSVVREELLQLSSVQKNGFKIHPLFVDQNNNILEYVLLSAYEGSIQAATEQSYKEMKYENFLNEKLASVSNAKPIAGSNNELTLINAEQLAQNRGNIWHILNMRAISAMQMLQLVEFGNVNGQVMLNEGICRIANTGNNINQSATTGSTKALGNLSGQASSTTFNYNNNNYTESTEGKCAITYRGYENPWGNIWQFVGDILISNSSNRHIPYICTNYNYNTTVNSNYQQLSFNISSNAGWSTGFGYDSNYDWIYLPIEMNSNGNSLAPIGDYFYGATSTSGSSCCAFGGPWFAELNNGPFYYALNWDINSYKRNCNARLILIPQYNNNIYVNNIIKWNTAMGG